MNIYSDDIDKRYLQPLIESSLEEQNIVVSNYNSACIDVFTSAYKQLRAIEKLYQHKLPKREVTQS